MKCPHCNGNGINRGTYAPPHRCPDCLGTGEIVCETCGNDEPGVRARCDNCGGEFCERCVRYVGHLMLCMYCVDEVPHGAVEQEDDGERIVAERMANLGAI